MIPHITLRENEAQSIRAIFSSWPKAEGPWIRALEIANPRIQRDLALRGVPFQLHQVARHPRTVRAAGVAGTFSVGNVLVDVVPKFVPTSALERWHSSVLAVLRRARRLAYAPVRANAARTTHDLAFVDHVAAAFAFALERGVNSEPIELYRTRSETSSFLRGRLDVERQVIRGFSAPGQLTCIVDYFDADNAYNQLLRWAGAKLVARTLHSGTRRRLARILARLPATSPRHRPSRTRLRVLPQHHAWREALDIAGALARQEIASPERGNAGGFSFLLNLESLFEGFVERTLDLVVRRFGETWRVESQRSRAFARPLTSASGVYYSRPDNVIFESDEARLLVDAKYKSLSESEDGGDPKRPRNTDVYQLAAALLAHDCPRGLLLYPKLAPTPAPETDVRAWRVDVGSRVLLLAAASVDIGDLSSADSLSALDSRVEALIRDAMDRRLSA